MKPRPRVKWGEIGDAVFKGVDKTLDGVECVADKMCDGLEFLLDGPARWFGRKP